MALHIIFRIFRYKYRNTPNPHFQEICFYTYPSQRIISHATTHLTFVQKAMTRRIRFFCEKKKDKQFRGLSGQIL